MICLIMHFKALQNISVSLPFISHILKVVQILNAYVNFLSGILYCRSFSSLNVLVNESDALLASQRYVSYVQINMTKREFSEKHVIGSVNKHTISNCCTFLQVVSVMHSISEPSRSLCCRKKVADSLMDTISSLDKFEQGIKNCLEA